MNTMVAIWADEIDENVDKWEKAHPEDHELFLPLRDIANEYRKKVD